MLRCCIDSIHGDGLQGSTFFMRLIRVMVKRCRVDVTAGISIVLTGGVLY